MEKPMDSVVYKVGTNKEKRRIWLEGTRLIASGFTMGQTYSVDYVRGRYVLTLDPNGKKKVSGKVKPNGDRHPIIDLLNKEITETFAELPNALVRFYAGKIVITPTDKE